MTADGTRRARPRWLLAAGLFVLAPFVGEFLLGNTPLTAAPWALMLAPLYGGGAVLVREVGRRAGGWPTMVLLAAAYALVEEGWVDQMLYNPGYLGLPDFADLAPIPALHISASLTVTSLVLHSVWSICVPIAIMEAFDPVAGNESRPWLGRVGLTVTVLIFVVGSAALALTQWDEHRFVGSPLQFGVTGIVIALLIMVGLRTRRSTPSEAAGEVPRPRRCGAVALGLTSAFWLVDIFAPWFLNAWAAIGLELVCVAVGFIVLMRWSGRPGWGRAHRFAVAAGALLTYVWLGFVHAPLVGTPFPISIIGNTVCGAIAVTLLVRAGRHHRDA